MQVGTPSPGTTSAPFRRRDGGNSEEYGCHSSCMKSALSEPEIITRKGKPVSLRAGTPAMTDTPPEFAEDARPCAGDSGHREAGGKVYSST